jgi:hypothetical protein
MMYIIIMYINTRYHTQFLQLHRTHYNILNLSKTNSVSSGGIVYLRRSRNFVIVYIQIPVGLGPIICVFHFYLWF